MAQKIIMPKQGLQMTEGTIQKWLVQEGGKVEQGQPLFEMETDKLTIVIDSTASGTLLKIVEPEGATVPITETIAVVGDAGEDISGILAQKPDGGRTSGSSPAKNEYQGEKTAAPQQAVSGAQGRDGRVFISPRAKETATRLGVDYRSIKGTAKDGMIVERDIAAAANAAPKATPLAKAVAALEKTDLSGVKGSGARGKITSEDVRRAARAQGAGEKTIVPMRGMRKIIAERMRQSLSENAQAVHRISVRMDEAVRMRKTYKNAGKDIGYNDIIAYATIRALREHPSINAELTGEGVWEKDFVNLGVAVAVDQGLIVPVVKNAELLNVEALSQSIRALCQKARDGRLSPAEYTGGSFTISNLGMFGLDEFEAIINPPEAGILAVGKIADAAVPINGAVEIHPVMKLTLSYDHRIIDGAPAARFLSRIKEFLEAPYLML